MMPPRRKPVAGKATGFLEIGKAGSVSISEDSPNALAYQAFRLRKRFPGLSWPVARSVAELAFQTGRARA